MLVFELQKNFNKNSASRTFWPKPGDFCLDLQIVCTGIFLPEVLFCSFLTTYFFSEKVVWGTWQSATSSSHSFSLPRYRKLFLNSKTFVGNVIKTTATATNADVSDGNVGDDDNDDVGDNADMTTMTMTMTQWKLDSCVYLSNNGAKAFIYFTVILNMTTGLDW